jgi:hypothetical protein
MPEIGGSNVEIAHRLNEAAKPTSHHSSRFEEVVEIIEAVVLALVAIATAWSGYQAARWEGNRTELYGESSKLRVTAEGLPALAGQEHLYDTTTFNAWLNAGSREDRKLAQFLERRFREEFRTAFRAWLATDPFNDPAAAPGPTFMPEYRNAKGEQAEELNEEALSTFAVVRPKGEKRRFAIVARYASIRLSFNQLGILPVTTGMFPFPIAWEFYGARPWVGARR